MMSLASLLISCVSYNKKINEVCILDIKENKCWINKSKGLGKTIDAIDGMYVLSENNIRDIFKRLNECKTQK